LNQVKLAETFSFNQNGYFDRAFGDPDVLIKAFDIAVEFSKVEFDSMAAIGLSGHMVLPLLARHAGVPFLALRKPDVKSHDTWGIGKHGRGTIGKKYLIVDDFVSTGRTVNNIRAAIDTVAREYNCPFTPEYVGTYCYAESPSRPETSVKMPSGAKLTGKEIIVDGARMLVNYDTYALIEMYISDAIWYQRADPKGYAIQRLRESTSLSEYGDMNTVAAMAVYAEQQRSK
jgi:hypothetical protein